MPTPVPYRTGPQNLDTVQFFEPQPLPPTYAPPPMLPQDDGAILWFGTPWGERTNLIHRPIPTPVGAACAHCSVPIQSDDNGYCLLHVAVDLTSGATIHQRDVLHRLCFVQACLLAGAV